MLYSNVITFVFVDVSKQISQKWSLNSTSKREYSALLQAYYSTKITGIYYVITGLPYGLPGMLETFQLFYNFKKKFLLFLKKFLL